MNDGTNESKYEARERADEPVFTLFGRDPTASLVVEEWARMRIAADENTEGDAQITRARAKATEMAEYARETRGAQRVARARKARDATHRGPMGRPGRAAIVDLRDRATDGGATIFRSGMPGAPLADGTPGGKAGPLVFSVGDREVMRFTGDGEMIVAPEFETAAAARAFWSIVRELKQRHDAGALPMVRHEAAPDDE